VFPLGERDNPFPSPSSSSFLLDEEHIQAFPFQQAAGDFCRLRRAQCPVTKQSLAVKFAHLALR